MGHTSRANEVDDLEKSERSADLIVVVAGEGEKGESAGC